MVLSKRRSVCVINLLTFLGKNKDIVGITNSSFCINFDQNMVGIYSDFSIGGIITIEFELKDFIMLAIYNIAI
jgi:hypothetical protein